MVHVPATKRSREYETPSDQIERRSFQYPKPLETTIDECASLSRGRDASDLLAWSSGSSAITAASNASSSSQSQQPQQLPYPCSSRVELMSLELRTNDGGDISLSKDTATSPSSITPLKESSLSRLKKKLGSGKFSARPGVVAVSQISEKEDENDRSLTNYVSHYFNQLDPSSTSYDPSSDTISNDRDVHLVEAQLVNEDNIAVQPEQSPESHGRTTPTTASSTTSRQGELYDNTYDEDNATARALQSVSRKQMNHRRYALLSICAGGLLVASGVIVGILFGVTVNNKVGDSPQIVVVPISSDAPTISPAATSRPMPEREQFLREIIPSFSLREIDADPQGPQAKALRWLMRNRNFGSYSPERLVQRYALATIFESTIGANWTENQNWMSDTDDCTWSATVPTTCDAGIRRRLDLEFNNLRGTLPPEIGLLSNLEELRLGHNALSGPLPNTIALLTRMREFFIGRNKWTGTIPTSVGRMQSLRFFNVFGASFDSTIPSEFGNLPNLIQLSASAAGLRGTIPSELGSLTKLTTLGFSSNRLTGTIPTNLVDLTNLRFCNIFTNNLMGSVPEGLWAIMAKTEYVNLDGKNPNGNGFTEGNRLTGTIPNDIGDHATEALKSFILRDNLFNGTLPTSMAKMVGLQVIDVSENGFWGEIPANLSAAVLKLYQNDFTGSVPLSVCNLTERILYTCGRNLTCDCDNCECFNIFSG